jgi:hypothetical protein
MDPNIDARIKSIEEKIDKTYDLVHKIRRVQKNSQIFRAFYWSIIILATFGAFYYIQPYVNGLINAYTGLQETQSQLQTAFPEIGSLNDILNQLKGN